MSATTASAVSAIFAASNSTSRWKKRVWATYAANFTPPWPKPASAARPLSSRANRKRERHERTNRAFLRRLFGSLWYGDDGASVHLLPAGRNASRIHGGPYSARRREIPHGPDRSWRGDAHVAHDARRRHSLLRCALVGRRVEQALVVDPGARPHVPERALHPPRPRRPQGRQFLPAQAWPRVLRRPLDR